MPHLRSSREVRDHALAWSLEPPPRGEEEFERSFGFPYPRRPVNTMAKRACSSDRSDVNVFPSIAISPRGLARSPVPSLGSPSVVAFLALFASAAGVLTLTPILSDVAADFDMSLAEAGQLRILAAPLAALVAVAAGRSLVRFSPRALLGLGSALLALGSIASAVAPTFALLAAAQVPAWAGAATLIAAGVAATASWSEPESRTRVVAHALAGPPTAWIVGMPVIGVVAEVNWRIAFVALPLPAALLVGVAVARRPGDAPLTGAGAPGSLAGLLGRGEARRWALGELLANSAWAGTLVFSGALFTEKFGMSTVTTGVALAGVAAAYLAGNRLAGRTDPSRARRAMLEGSVGASVAVALTWALTPPVGITLLLFAAAAFVAARRTVAGTVYGFQVSGDLGREVGSIRAATDQIGYLVGSLLGGLALAIGGFSTLAVGFGGLFLASTLPYVCIRRACRTRLALEPTL
jgi:DHA1 family inner membrane transport protein